MKANMIGIPEELKTIIILGIVNGAIRPAGASYRDALANGDYNDNGHKVLNDFLSPTLGYLIFQEQIIEFLNRFCGFTMGEADTVRRGFAKKTGTEKYIPRITSGFIKIMHDEYGVCKKESEAIIISFLKVIEDASFYLFSKNHADPYSMLGFATAYLRTYHPLEFFTSMLEVNLSNMDKTNQIMKYINKFTNIRVKPAQFGRSTAHYSCSKENNTIYKGIASIKTLGVSVGDAFEKLNSGSYKTFMDALDGIYQYDNVMYIRRYERALKDDLKVLKKQWKEDGFNKDEIKEKNEVEKTIIANKVKDERVMCPTNQLVGDSAIELLIGLSFFKEYGKSQYLINILKAYSKIRYAMALKKSSLESLDIEWIKIIINNSKETDSQYSQLDTDKILPEIIDIIQDVDISIDNCLLLQAEYLGYINGELIENPPSKYCIINMVNKRYTPYLRLQSLTGKQFDAKIDKRTFNYKLEQGDILELRKIVKKPQYKMVGEKTNGKPDYVEDKTKPLIIWVTDYRVVEKGGE
jgi:DNA polymerase-3 subunit alpha